MLGKIRDYAKKAGFEVDGKLDYKGKWDSSNRYYADQSGNIYLVDVVIGGLRIIPNKKRTRDFLVTP